MATNVHVLSDMKNPRLWIWRDQTEGARSQLAHHAEGRGLDAEGLHLFSTILDHHIQQQAHVLLHEGDTWDVKEPDEHTKTIPRTAQYSFPEHVWCAHGASRVLVQDPFAASEDRLRVHLITASKYRDGKLCIWAPEQPALWIEASGSDACGPYFDVELQGRRRHLFLFKFQAANGAMEPERANRLWCAHDGKEIWCHSQASSISTREPEKQNLVVRVLEFTEPPSLPKMHLWQEDSDFAVTLEGERESSGWVRFETSVYSGRQYRVTLFNEDLEPQWEHSEARRNVMLDEDGAAWTMDGDGSLRRLGNDGVWTIEGDHEVYGSAPSANKRVSIEVSARAPECALGDALVLDVWVNRARKPMIRGLRQDESGRWSFETFAEVVISFRFRADEAHEDIERHTTKVRVERAEPTHLFVVLGRSDPLSHRQVQDLFLDAPFEIVRPGAWLADGYVRFALHCPTAACAEVIGEWTDWQAQPLAMRSTQDGTYWWAEVATTDITDKLGRSTVHGVLYKYRLNQTRLVQDPAADWVENSDPNQASKLVDHALYQWQSTGWQRPGWDWLTVYQVHPARFSQRKGTQGLDGITRELSDASGYLRQLKATAVLLMPVCEFAGDHGWGYNPSYFYAVESAFGGPDALKRLVDACHSAGRAVLLDVVFNHAGASDNVLWSVASQSYFDGDTEWGAMINFDHPQVIHFFEQNLIHFMRNYRVDGFRFDFTRVIRFGHQWTSHVKQPGSGGGWEFMHRLRAAVRNVDSRCILMAENLPNDWDLTRTGGPMDTQWCDAFHDRIEDAARGLEVMGPLADALKVTESAECEHWYDATNYSESHDEVGNEPDRISRVAGPGQGYRRNKVAAAATVFSRGIPLLFMGEESGEWRQFSKDGGETLDLDYYERDESALRLRRWWNRLFELRVGNSRIQGPAPIRVHFAQEQMLAFSRGDAADVFVVLNFGHQSWWRPLDQLNLPQGQYMELLNSTWGDYAVESEDEHPNGGWDVRLQRGGWLNIPDYGVVVLERR